MVCKHLKDKVDSFYRSTGLNPDIYDYNNFHENKEGHLFYRKVRLTHRNDPSKFLSLDTLRTKFGGINEMRTELFSFHNFRCTYPQKEETCGFWYDKTNVRQSVL